MRRPEGRNNFDASGFHVRTTENDNDWPGAKFGLAQGIDLVLICSDEGRDRVPSPCFEPPVEPSRVGSDDCRVEFVAANDEDGLGRDRRAADTWLSLVAL